MFFCTIHVTFPIQITRQLGNPLSLSQQGCTHCWITVLFALVKLAFVALLSGNILWFGSRVAFTSRAVNTIMQKGCGHLLATMTAKHWKLMCLFCWYIHFWILHSLLTYTVRFFFDTFQVQWHAHISHVVSTNSCYRAQKRNGWPLVNNVASVQSKEMNGQTSDVAVISCWPRPARTPPPPPPPLPLKKKVRLMGP